MSTICMLACGGSVLSVAEEVLVNKKWKATGRSEYEYIIFKENHSYEIYTYITLTDFGIWSLKNRESELNLQSLKTYKDYDLKIISLSETELETENHSFLNPVRRAAYKAIQW